VTPDGRLWESVAARRDLASRQGASQVVIDLLLEAIPITRQYQQDVID
tara:strand:- start:880 stop:1023 length:144 start_codon:yes stop_codon:yes gene_type:complete